MTRTAIMKSEDLFEGFQSEEHAREAEQRWGNMSSWKVAHARTSKYSADQERAIKAEHSGLLRDRATLMQSGAEPSSTEAMGIAERARLRMDRWYYPLSREAHVGLAQMYVTDPRFERTYEDVAPGLARYMARAIESNVSRD